MDGRLFVLALVACSSTEKTPAPQPARTRAAADLERDPPTQRRATVRIDAEVGGKGFQGVWLELANGKRWVISYRAHEYWRPFEDAEVVVTGFCYGPFGQAIAGQHFHVDTMRFFEPKHAAPSIDVGPELRLRGKFSGSLFVTDDANYAIAGANRSLDRDVRGTVTINARTVGAKLWILGIVRDEPDPAYADTPMACPREQ